MHNYRKFKDYHIERLRDPKDAEMYLSVALEDYKENKDKSAFLLAVNDVKEAQGDISLLKEVGIFQEVSALAGELSVEDSLESDRNSEDLKGSTKPITKFFQWLRHVFNL